MDKAIKINIKKKNIMDKIKGKYQITTVDVPDENGVMHPTTKIIKPINYGFHKVWLEDILNVLNTVGNAKIKILTTLLRIMDKQNYIHFTLEYLTEISGVSYPTTCNTIKELLEAEVLQRDKLFKQRYMFNPALIMQGDGGKSRRLLIEYVDLNNEQIRDNEQKNKNLEQLKNEYEDMATPSLPFAETKKKIISKEAAGDEFIKIYGELLQKVAKDIKKEYPQLEEIKIKTLIFNTKWKEYEIYYEDVQNPISFGRYIYNNKYRLSQEDMINIFNKSTIK